jgi:hypothetical protein
MLIQIESKEQFIEELRKMIGKEISIYFKCDSCEEEDIYDTEEITEEMVEQFEEEGFIEVVIQCSICGGTVYYLRCEDIRAIED